MSPPDQVATIGRDPDALEAFYREHLDAVQRFVARRVRDPHDAADLTADVFVAAIEASAGYRGEAVEPRAWLYGIARRVAASHLRRAARGQRAASRLSSQPVLDDDAVERIAGRIDSERAARGLFEQVQSLPESQRAVFELVAVDGLSAAEAAAALGISPGNARVRYHRARMRLDLPATLTCEVPS
jgi:RNA polymerase sigma-70 factor (ECF subfamily)